MLRIYTVLLELVRAVKPLAKQIRRHDKDLAEQLCSALNSGPLNVAEGSHSQGGNRPARYYNALGSLREALACLEVAEAWGYVEPLDPAIRRRFQHVIGTLVKNVRP
jgi:four helix bundle protein